MSVTNYHRFKAHSVFGLVGTGQSIEFITRLSQPRKFVAVTACQLVVVWDIIKRCKVATLQCPDVSGVVTLLCRCPPSAGSINNTHLAAGYSTGHVIVYSIKENVNIDPTVFAGHRGPVTALAWDHVGMRLASGGSHGEIVIWDVLSERGVVRLRGHKGAVARIIFLKNRDVLVTSGRDGFIKFWEVSSGHCFRTLATDKDNRCDIALVKDDTRLIIGGNDAALTVWGLTFKDTVEERTAAAAVSEQEKDDREDDPNNKFFCLDTDGQNEDKPDSESESDDNEAPPLPADDASILSLELLGSMNRTSVSQVLGLQVSGSVLACYGKKGALDLFRVLDDEQVAERIRRRLKKTRKRLKSGSEMTETETAMCATAQLADEMRLLASVPVHGRLSAVCAVEDQNRVFLATLYTDNSLAVLKWSEELQQQDGGLAASTVCHLTSAGHRCEVRAAQFSSVGDTLVTLSNEAIKTWHKTQYECQCTMTVPLTTHVRTLLLAPGDRQVVLGTSSGHLLLVDLTTGHMMADIAAAHTALGEEAGKTDVTALALTADSRGLISGGSDQNVRYWKFELVSDETSGQRLSLEATDVAVSMNDAVTALQCSSDGRLLAVATIDNKETLYYADTMKLHQELYGKSMPSYTMSFSSDGDLLVTGSRDSMLRIYGTDFGDMRKLIKNAHTHGVTCVQFQAKTHLFFSAGYDGCLNYWDADSFQRIMTLKGHQGIIRCMSLPPKGNFVATGGEDRSLRLWERTEELLELSEEREEERRRQEEEEGDGEELMAGQAKFVEGDTKDAEAVRASKPSYRTDVAVDMIIEGLRMYKEHLSNPDAAPHYLMLTYGIMDPLKCFTQVLTRIKPSELEEAIVQLELPHVLSLLVLLCRLGVHKLTEVAVRVALLSVRTNLTQLVNCRHALPLIKALNNNINTFTELKQGKAGFSRAGLRQCADRLERRSETQLYVEAMDRLSKQKKKRKNKEIAIKRAILSL